MLNRTHSTEEQRGLNPNYCDNPMQYSRIHSERLTTVVLFVVTLVAVALNWTAALAGTISDEPIPVYTDDSPEAVDLLTKANSQRALGNIPDTIRIYKQLLENFPTRLILEEHIIASLSRKDITGQEDTVDPNALDHSQKVPSHGKIIGDLDEELHLSSRYITVRSGVLRILQSNKDLLDAYRSTHQATAAQLLREGQLVEVYGNYPLTTASLEAGLQLIADNIQRGRIDAASHMLAAIKDHPDLEATPDALTRYATMTGLAGIIKNREMMLAAAYNALASQGGNTAVEITDMLSRFHLNYQPPPGQGIHAASDVLVEPTLVATKPQVVWRYLLNSRSANILASTSINSQAKEQMRADVERGYYANLMPVTSGDQILISDGLVVTSIDRFDGRKLWEYPQSIFVSYAFMADVRRRGATAATGDPAAVATDGRHVISILYPSGSDDGSIRSSNELVCLDTHTGEPIWTAFPELLTNELEGAAFTGQPTIHEGTVIVLVRKPHQRLASDYLVCLDLVTGDLRWAQYLISSNVRQSGEELKSATPLIVHGDAYVSSPLGCIARIELDTGLIQWLRTQKPAKRQAVYSRQDGRPWEYDQPLLLNDQLITISPNHDSIMILDITDGEIISAYQRSAFGNPSYLISDGHIIYAVGRQIRTFDPKRDTPIGQNLIQLDSGEHFYGRVSCGDGLLAVPTNDYLRMYDSDTGVPGERLPLSQPGTPLIVGAELIIATSDGVDSFLPFEVSAPQLQTRMEAEPHNAQPAISLAGIAAKQGQYEHILPAIDAAIGVISTGSLTTDKTQTQLQLFNILLELSNNTALTNYAIDGEPIDRTTNDRSKESITEALFIRLNLISASAQQRIYYLLSFGDYLVAHNRIGEAVDAFQTILINDSLADEMCEMDSTQIMSNRASGDVISRSDNETIQDHIVSGDNARNSGDGRRILARFIAKDKLRDLVVEHGSSILALYDDMSMQAYHNAKNTHDTNVLLGVMQKYPLQQAGALACREAVTLYLQANQTATACVVAKRGLQMTPNITLRSEILGLMLEGYESAKRYDLALSAIREAEINYPFIILPSSNGIDTYSISQWRQRIENTISQHSQSAHIGSLSNRPVRAEPGDDLLLPRFGQPSTKVSLIRVNATLSAFGGSDFRELWSYHLSRKQVELLRIEHDRAIFWIWNRYRPERLFCLDLNSGNELWAFDIAEAARIENDIEDVTSKIWSQGAAKPITPASTLGLLYVVTGIENNVVFCIETTKGKKIWEHNNAHVTFESISCEPLAAVAAGVQTAATPQTRNQADHDITQRNQPVILMMNPNNGAVAKTIEVNNEYAFHSVTHSNHGIVIIGVGDVLIGYDLLKFEERYRVSNLQGPWKWPLRIGNQMFIADSNDTVWSVDFKTGNNKQLRNLKLVGRNAAPPRVYTVGGRILLKTYNGVFVFEEDGRRTGELARSGSTDITIAAIAAAGDRIVVLQTQPERLSESRRKFTMYDIDWTGKRINTEITPETSLPKIDAAQVIDGWVIVNTGNRVLIFDAP